MQTPSQNTCIPQWLYNFYDMWDDIPFKSYGEAVKLCQEAAQTSGIKRKIISAGGLYYIAIPKY